MTTLVSIAQGGTGSNNAAAARSSLGAAPSAAYDAANNAYAAANTASSTGGGGYAQANAAYAQANAAYNNSNTKLSTSGGSISGDLAITGNLTVQGNATTINVSNLSVNDSMILLSTNAVGDSNDIGFIGHFDRGPTATHAGLIRKATQNQFYLFDNYEVEPTNNVIDVAGNNFTVGNLRLGIINANSYVTSAGLNVTDQANAAYGQANAAYSQANAAYGAANNRVLKAGDTMTGQLNISSGGLIVTGGNVGIGTSNVQAKLHVVSQSLANVNYNNQGAVFFEASESQVQIISDDGGSHASKLTLSTVEQSTGNNKHWMLDHKGPSLGNRFDISYFTSNSSGNILAPSGVELLTLLTNGNVGVGTTNPATRLDVRANTNDIFQIESASHSTLTGLSAAAAFSRGNDGSGRLGAIFGWNNGGLAIAARGGIVFATGGSSTYSATSRVVDITDGGNVGIGTTSISGRLHIGSGTVTDNNSLVLNRGAKPSIGVAQVALLSEWNGIGSAESLTFMADAGYKFLDDTGNTEWMRILSSGNIGIGTITPVTSSLTGALTIYKLHGSDTVGNVPSVTGQTYSDNQSNLYLFGRNAGITVVSKFSEGGHLIFADDDGRNRGAIEYGHTTDVMTLSTAGSGKVTILSGGNVGIATTNPGTKLHVNDSVAAYWTGSSFTGGNPSIATITNSYPGGYDAALRFQMTGQSGINGQQRDVGYIGFVGTASWAADASADASMYVLTRNPSSNTVVERMRIDSGGRITTPGQPSFMARRTTSFTISVATVITYDSELGDRGGYYNASNGRFTAPVTGYYMFKAHLQPTTSGVSVNINFWVNGSATTYASVGTTSLSARGDIENVIVLPLNTNDYVEVVCSVSSSCGFDNHGIFCGFLIG